MDSEIISFLGLIVTVAIAVATIWIAVTANRISRLQLSMDLERQKLDWCRACLQSVSQAVTLASYSESEVDAVDFEKQRRKLRGEIIAHKNEGELFLTKPGENPIDVPSLHALRKCYKAMDGQVFRPPCQRNGAGASKVKAEMLAALQEFRQAMRDDFGNAWTSPH